MEGEDAQQQQQQSPQQQRRATLESDGGSQATSQTFVGGATATPFIYPIRSLLGSVQPAPAQPNSNLVDPAVYNDLAASLKRELAAKRAAHGQGESRPSSVTASPEAGTLPGTRTYQASRATELTSATFPSTFNLPNRVTEYVKLPSTQGGDVTPSTAENATPAPAKADLKTWDAATGEKDTLAKPEGEDGGPAQQKRPAVTVEESTSDVSSSLSSIVRLPPAPTEKEFDENNSHQSQQGKLGSGQTPSHRQPSTREYQGPPVTVRLKYQQDEHGHHHVIGREGNLTRCEDEVNSMTCPFQLERN